MRNLCILLLLLLPFAGAFSQSAQFRGVNRDGVYQETGLLKSWPDGGPECIFTAEGIGTGYSSAVLAGGTLYVTGMKEAKDYLSAITPDGKIKWQVAFGNSWTQSFPDSRCTPTVEGNRIYVISGTGRLACIDTAGGKDIWAAEVDKDFESQWHDWGVAESLLLVDNLVICSPAGKKAALVAYDKLTGKLVWQTKSIEGQRSYASPVIFKWKDFRYIIAATTKQLIAVIPETGGVAWSYVHWQADREAREDGDQGQIFTNNPVIRENEIFLTRGYNYPCIMLSVSPDGKSVTEKWIDKTLDNHHHGTVVSDGYIYGSNWISNGKGNWVCLDWNTGAVKWEQTWNNKGPVILADGMLYIIDEKNGNIALVKADPARFNLVSYFRITKGTGPYWAHPSIFDGKLFIRHGDVLMGFKIKQ
jgi:outer membrane protein assembly factor BamB